VTASPRNDRSELPMPSQTTEVRCPECARLLLGLSDDFVGAVSARCRHCRIDGSYPRSGDVPTIRLNCRCGRWIATGRVERGSVRAHCRRCRALMAITASATLAFEQAVPRPTTEPDLVAAIEARWLAMGMDRARRSAVAVGIRFEVFQRDHFRCRYCGASPDDGAVLEADHVVPLSVGGETTLSNLVTACWDCNHGKGARRVDFRT